MSSKPAPSLLGRIFGFLASFQQSTGVQDISDQEKEQLFDEFVRWYNTQR